MFRMFATVWAISVYLSLSLSLSVSRSLSLSLSLCLPLSLFLCLRGRGGAVGFLKVGYKKLFLLDQRGAHIETEPLCVLDFYITENLQRHGCGLDLFNFMLQHKKVEPELLAYDRPSPKFLAFLGKHFNLKEGVPQVNNFVVFNGFFKSTSAVPLRKVPPRKPEGEIKPYSLVERDVVREEQRVPPWPFVRPGGPLPSPPVSRSLSVGSSPSRAPPTALHAHTHLSDNYRARRTSSLNRSRLSFQ
ncbi:alpha-tubulin N-acetyltransferase 1 [Clupea harengus]|uniref:Alpha-tubulin N-acetyltransferase 1 n=1 Tax=Clupea harengus TaxID=7950 RepID=A0A8M1KVG7_CLUHA|nr:alpha-tubulin N-acetyltransferase 1 [Clupea harengus]